MVYGEVRARQTDEIQPIEYASVLRGLMNVPSRSPVIYYTCIAAIGGLLFGFDTAVISGADSPLERFFSLDAFRLGATVAAALLGTIVGSLLIEIPAESFGRKATLSLLAAIFTVTSIASALSFSWVCLILSRFLAGLAIGGASVAVPMYIAEIAPPALRGRLVIINQLNIVFGSLVAMVSNYFVARMFAGDEIWRPMFGAVALPSALFLFLLFKIPESPRWLVKVGRLTAALGALKQLGCPAPHDEILNIQQSMHGTAAERLFQHRYLYPIALSITLTIFNQLSGITALTYAPRIFGMADSSKTSALLESIALGGANLFFTILAIALIDRVGRRQLIIYGSIGCIISLATVTWAFYDNRNGFTSHGQVLILAGVIAFQASHAIGQGAVLWVFISEIFPTAVRSKGQALATCCHWMMAAIIGWSFPALVKIIGGEVFGFFAAAMVLQLFFAWKVMPETKDATLEEIARWTSARFRPRHQ